MGGPDSLPDDTRRDIRRFVTQLAQPSEPITAEEVADELGCTPETARDWLAELAERDLLRSKQLDGSTRVWWCPSDDDDDDRGQRIAARTQLEHVLETVPVGIGVVAADGELVRGNDRLLERIDGSAGSDGSDGSNSTAEPESESELADYSIDAWELYDTDGDPIPTDDWPWKRALETGASVSNYECRVEIPDVGSQWLSINAAPIADDVEGDPDPERVVIAIDDITDRIERERRLRREYDQTEKLLQTAPIAIAVQNADRETVRANRRAQEAFGLSEQEFLENPVDTGEWKVYDADGNLLDSDQTTSARVLETGEPVFDEELIFEPPDGGRLHFRVNTAPLFGPDGSIERIVTAAKDITELKAREQQLEQRKSELETELSEILGRISDAFYALDEEWRFTHLNERAIAIMDRSEEELLGLPVWEVIPDATEDFFRERYRTAMETQDPVSFEIEAETFDAWLEFNVYPSESGLSVYFRDITDRKEYQRKLEESNERLEQFAYAASHDLQEPLRMVTSYLQLLEDRYADELDDDAAEFIDFAVDGADRMREMIDGLLEYSRVETQGDPFEPIDLDEILADTRDNLQVQIEESGAEIASDELPRVAGDESQLQQVFQNLISNAIEYSGDASPEVRVTAERTGELWRISVRDNGIGIDPEDQDCIFEVFQRLHTHEEHPGTGIGLALCRRIVERHGGDIRVDSKPGEGTTFSFTLPAVDSASAARGA